MRYRRPFNYGAIVSAVHNDGYWIEAQQIATEMTVSHKHKMDSPPVGPVRLVKLGVQAVKGLKYYMTFRVPGENGITVDYTATVWIKIADHPNEILSFDKVPGSERKANCHMILDGNGEGCSRLLFGEEFRKLCHHGFYILLKNIRIQKPSLSYAKARKAASSEWAKLPEHEKIVFVVEAAKRLKKK